PGNRTTEPRGLALHLHQHVRREEKDALYLRFRARFRLAPQSRALLQVPSSVGPRALDAPGEAPVQSPRLALDGVHEPCGEDERLLFLVHGELLAARGGVARAHRPSSKVTKLATFRPERDTAGTFGSFLVRTLHLAERDRSNLEKS